MPYQVVAETRLPLALQVGQPQRYDYEYRRMGTCNLFLFFNPFAGWRHAKVTEQRTKQDFAHCMQELVDVHFPDAEVIRVILDQLNTHTYAALYETFEPAEARRLARKLEFHYTPKHGSWLNMAESELGVVASQCLDRRFPDKDFLAKEVAAWQDERNTNHTKANWRFTTADARIKLKHLYPQFE
jgi:hypothetical protein